MKPKVEALREQFRTGNIRTNNAKVLKFIIDNKDATVNDLRKGLGMAHQTLTSRLSDLKDMGLIYEEGTRQDLVGDKPVTFTVYTFESNRINQKIRAENVRREKYKSLVKRMENEFKDLFDKDYIRL
jgi:DNA-binding transcriptional ArsR family regulator